MPKGMSEEEYEKPICGKIGQDETVGRRDLVKAVGATTIASALSGCGQLTNSGNGEAEDMGERVPTISISYLTGFPGFTQKYEQLMPLLTEDLEKLGLDINVTTHEPSEAVSAMTNDSRAAHFHLISSRTSPDRIEPQEWLSRFSIENAGEGDGFNISNWANCEYSLLEEDQRQQPPEERIETVKDALRTAMDEYVVANITGAFEFQVAHVGRINLGGVGSSGYGLLNPNMIIKTTPKSGDELRVFTGSSGLQRKNWMTIPTLLPMATWNNLIYSTPLMYDENFELQPNLGETTVSEDAKTVTLELFSGATFHNGEPITAEHVKFTYEFISEHQSSIYKATELPLDSIETIDENTVEFALNHPYPQLINRDLAIFGIMYKDEWEAAEGNIENFSIPEAIGSGPFKLENFSTGQSMFLTPHDGHPQFNPDHNVTIISYGDMTTAAQAFQAGEVDILSQVPPSTYANLTEDSNVEGGRSVAMYPGPALYPQIPMTPTKFKEFRNAIGTAINRQRINEVVQYGEGTLEMHGGFIMSEHPWFPDDGTHFTDNPQGDIDAARNALSESGWTWDNNDRLHYPPDVDLTPIWQQGSEPSAENFECINDLTG